MKCSEFIRELTKLTSDGSDPEIVMQSHGRLFESALIDLLMMARIDMGGYDTEIKGYSTSASGHDQETVIRIW